MTMYDDNERGSIPTVYTTGGNVYKRTEDERHEGHGSLSRGPRATASKRPPISRAATQYYCAAFDCH